MMAIDYVKLLDFYNVEFSKIAENGEENHEGTCPFCNKPKHFSINRVNGRWGCFRCGTSGGIRDFLEAFWRNALKQTTIEHLQELQDARGGHPTAGTLKRFGVAYDLTSKRWLIPVFDSNSKLQTLRTCRRNGKLFNTPELPSALWNAQALVADPSAPVWLCEGEWDGMAWAWVLQQTKSTGVVVAVPGANVMLRDWLPLLQYRNVIMAYDADGPGDDGMTKRPMTLVKEVASSVRFVRWSLEAPTGYDLRDLVTDQRKAVRAYSAGQALIAEAPRTVALSRPSRGVGGSGGGSWSRGGKTAPRKTTTNAGEGVPIDPGRPSLMGVAQALGRWIHTDDQMMNGLRCVLGTILSTQIPGDPLWMYLVGPPGSGKTALLHPLRAATNHCIFQSSMSKHALVSGFRGPNDSDPSLLPKLHNKTLVLKDMTEILSAPYHVQEEIYSTFRGAYDGTVERPFGNAVHRRYEVHFSFLAGVTNAIHASGRASLGERMLKYQFAPERSQRQSAARQAIANVGKENQMDSELSDVMCGFLDQQVDVEELRALVPEEIQTRIIALAELVAKCRGEVVRDFRGEQILYRPSEEGPSRLSKQLMKMAMILPMVAFRRRLKFTDEDYRILEKVALDTAIGWNMDVIQSMLYLEADRDHADDVWVSRREMVEASRVPESNMTRRIEDMLMFNLIEKRATSSMIRSTPQTLYQLNPEVRELWKTADIRTHLIGREREIKTVRSYDEPA